MAEDEAVLRKRLFDACQHERPEALLSLIEEGKSAIRQTLSAGSIPALLAEFGVADRAAIEQEVLDCREHKIAIACLREGEARDQSEDEINDETDARIADMSQDATEDDILDRLAEKKMTRFLNESKDGSGKYLLHVAASQGRYYPMRELYDLFDGFECDPRDTISGKTPLHYAVEWVNSQPRDKQGNANQVVELMLDASGDSLAELAKDRRTRTPLRQLVQNGNEGLLRLIDDHEARIQQEREQERDQKQLQMFFDASGARKYDEVQEGEGGGEDDDDDDDDAEYSGSDDEERAEFERLRAARKAR